MPAIRGEIIFDNVNFRTADAADHPGHVGQIEPASRRHRRLLGSGKSTIAKLIQRLYIPESGRVLVDASTSPMVDPAWLRRQLGVVLQESVLMRPLGARQHRAGRPRHAVRTDRRGGQASPAPMSSSSTCPRATTPWSASVAAAFRAASVSASRSRAPWS